jgi:hypothetical protein
MTGGISTSESEAEMDAATTPRPATPSSRLLLVMPSSAAHRSAARLKERLPQKVDRIALRRIPHLLQLSKIPEVTTRGSTSRIRCMVPSQPPSTADGYPPEYEPPPRIVPPSEDPNLRPQYYPQSYRPQVDEVLPGRFVADRSTETLDLQGNVVTPTMAQAGFSKCFRHRDDQRRAAR